MSSNCLSSASILRCIALSRTQNVVIFLPAVIQLTFTIGLVVCRWGTSRKHILVAADGWAFFILTFVDLLAHVLSAARNSISTFKVFDIIIGALSFFTILFYTSFLYVTTRDRLLPMLHLRFHQVMKYTLLVFIPVSVGTNEIGAFIGVSYENLTDENGNPVLAIGFRRSGDAASWQFFSAITLALLIAFQSVIFSISAYIFGKSYLEQRRIDRVTREKDEPNLGSSFPPVPGVIWVALAVMFGVVESLLGFVDGGFAVILTRRIIRLVSRTCLMIAIFQGLEGDPGIQGSCRPRRRRRNRPRNLRGMISNPRNSTFAKLSPGASAFNNLRRPGAGGAVADAEIEPTTADFNTARRQQRVTVRYEKDEAPTLQMRLSDLRMPSPDTLTATFKKRGTMLPSPQGEELREVRTATHATSAYRSESPIPMPEPAVRRHSLQPAPRPAVGVPARVPAARGNPAQAAAALGRSTSDSSVTTGRARGAIVTRPKPALHHGSQMSVSSGKSETLNTRSLVEQFPSAPSRNTDTRSRNKGVSGLPSQPAVTRTPSRSGSYGKRKAPPSIPGSVSATNSQASSAKPRAIGMNHSANSSMSSLARSNGSTRRKPVPIPPPINSAIARPIVEALVSAGSIESFALENNTVNLSRSTTSVTPGLTIATGVAVSSPTTPNSPELFGTSHPYRESDLFVSGRGRGLGAIAARVVEIEKGRAAKQQQNGTLVAVDLDNDPFGSLADDGESVQRISESLVWPGRKAPSDKPRIKSIGRVPTRQTPTPSTSESVRNSMRIEEVGKLGEIGKNSLNPFGAGSRRVNNPFINDADDRYMGRGLRSEFEV